MKSLYKIGIIGAGGCCGAILRYLVSGLIQQRSGLSFFPIGTMGVNLIGCFFIGLVTLLVEAKGALSPELRTFVLIGVLGAFTTFSTFGNETFNLLKDGRVDLAILNSVAQVIFGLLMVWLGRLVATLIWRV